jgi:hypothetical protein
MAGLLLAISPQITTRAADHDRELLVGTWRLVKYADTPEGERPIQVFGPNPIGYFVFTADGHASISIMRNPPDITSTVADPDPDVCIPGWAGWEKTYPCRAPAGT